MTKNKAEDPKTGPVLHQTIEIKNPSSKSATSEAESLPDFWEYVASIKDEQWGNPFKIYLYRDTPRISTISGYLEVLQRPFDIEYVREVYGGGEFRAMLNGNNGKMVHSLKFQIMGPPKYTSRETGAAVAPAAGGDPNTMLLNQIVDMVSRRQDQADRVMLGGGVAGTGGAAFKEALSIMTEANKTAMALVLQNMPKTASITEQIQAMGTLLQSMRPQQDDSVMKLLMPILMEQLTGDPFAKMQKYMSMAKDFGAFGDGGAARSNPLKDIGMTLVENAPRILESAGTLMDKWERIARHRTRETELRINAALAARAMAPAIPPTPATAAPAPPVNNAPNVVPISTAAAQAREWAAMETEDVAAAPYVEPAAAPAGAAVAEPELDWVARRMVWMIQNGRTADDVISFIDGAMPELARSLAGATREQVEQFFKSHPILKEAAEDPGFEQFLTDAMERIKEMQEEAQLARN